MSNEHPDKLQRLRTLHLFAGAGGGILADLLLGHQPVCAVEIDRYCQQVLVARQRDCLLPWFPIFGDIREFDGRPWRGLVDIVAGGFPCKGISPAGDCSGLNHPESGLWSEMARVIGEIRPAYAFVENSSMLVGRGLTRILGELAEMGMHARWGVVSAADAIWLGGIPQFDHERARTFVSASDSNRVRELQSQGRIANERGWPEYGFKEAAYALRKRRRQVEQSVKGGTDQERSDCAPTNGVSARGWKWWLNEPCVDRMVHGVARRVDRIRAIGNGQVSAVAGLAWRLLT